MTDLDMSGVARVAGSPTPLHSAQLNELATALAKAQGEIKPAKKDRENPFYRSDYATLDSVMDAIREPLAKNGLAVLQPTDGAVLHTILLHSSGQFIRTGDYPLRPMRQESKEKGGGWVAATDPQSLGSAITYCRRYSLCALLGIVAEEDDDGEAASPRDQETREKATSATIAKRKAAIAGAANLAALKAIGKVIAKDPDAVREAVRDAYTDKLHGFSTPPSEWKDPGPPEPGSAG